MTMNNSENIYAISINEKIENRKLIDVTPSHILFYFSFAILVILIWPVTVGMTLLLMGNDMTIPILGCYCLIGIALVLLTISINKYKFRLLSLISAVYSLLIGFIYFRVLPAMKELEETNESLAETYESTDSNSSFTSSHGFDPSTVDFAFYNQLLLIILIFFISLTIISGIGVIRNERKKKCTKFKIVEY